MIKKIGAFLIAGSLLCMAGGAPLTAFAQDGLKLPAHTAEPGEALPVLEEMLKEPEEARILVDGEVTDTDAMLCVSSNGITILQYETEKEAQEAADAFEEDGYTSMEDQILEVTAYGDDNAGADVQVSALSSDDSTFSTYEAQYMNLQCNAEGDEDVLIAVIDTGANVQYLDSDRFVTGYNGTDGSTDVTDNYGHGTMTASILSAYTGSNVSIMPIKMIDSESTGTTYAGIIACFEYALSSGADVVSMSLGLEVDATPQGRMQMQEYERYLSSYVEAIVESGATFVVAAGNSNTSTDYVFPACVEECWTVSSIGESYERSYFSNYGDVDYCAPGEGITVVTNTGSSETNDGTSFSAPLVAVAAAQLAGIGYDTNDARDAYMQTICYDPGTSGYDRYYGYGMPQLDHYYRIETTTATCQTAGDTTYTCDCGETYSVTGETIDHIAGDPVIADTDDGGQVWSYYCTMCGELMKEVTYTAEEVAAMNAADDTNTSEEEDDTDAADDSYTVPTSAKAASKVSLTGATVSQVTQTLAFVKGDGDLADSAYSVLRARAKKVTQTSVKVRWKKVSGAKSYVVYGTKCGSSNKYKKIKKLTGTSLTVKKIAGTKLKKGTYYKFIVVAFDADGKVIETSKTIHAATKGGTKTNAKSIAIYKSGKKVTSLSIQNGSTAKITTKTTKQQAKKTIKTHRKVKYESGNTNVAKVSANGKITAKKKGTCYIYAYAQNGVFKRIKVTVK